MTDKEELFEILACPRCLGKLIVREQGKALDCDQCKLRYPIVDGIPLLVSEDARPFQEES